MNIVTVRDRLALLSFNVKAKKETGDILNNHERILFDAPIKGMFCGTNHYLSFSHHEFSQRSFPILEEDSYFLLVEKGIGEIYINGEVFPLYPGCVCWIQGFQTVVLTPFQTEQPLKFSTYMYDYQLANYLMICQPNVSGYLSSILEFPVLEPKKADCEEIYQILRQLADYDAIMSPGSTLIKVALVGQLAILFARQALKQPSPENRCLAWRASVYLAANSTKVITLTTTAKMFSVTGNTLERAIKLNTGQSFSQMLDRVQVIHAASYLLHKNLPLNDILRMSGFEAAPTFFRNFKQVMGITPSEYRDAVTCYTPERFRGPIYGEPLAGIIYYLYCHLSEHVTLKTISQNLFFSESSIRTMLFQSFGMSFKDVLNLFRIRYAESLLAGTDLSLMNVSTMAGFNAYTTFIRTFSKINHVLPSEYREQCEVSRREH